MPSSSSAFPILQPELLYSNRYESELKLKQSVEADIAGLLRLIDEFTLIKANLEHEVESIREELGHMKRSHQEVRKHTIEPKKSEFLKLY